MELHRKEKRYGARPVARQAGRVPGPEPRRGPPLATGGGIPQGDRKVRPTPKRSKTCSPDKAKESNVSNQGPANTAEKNLPQTKSKIKDPLKVFQFNVCGLSTKKFELSYVLHSNGIHVALLQETQHAEGTDIEISGYTSYPCSCKDCQGVITYLRNDLVGTVINLNSIQPAILQKAEIWYEGCKYKIYNIYNPPRNNLNLISEFSETQFSKTIVGGDFNGHSPSWGYKDLNETGKEIESFCNSTNLCLLQDSSSPPTLFHRAHKTSSRPDLTMVSADLLLKIQTEVLAGIGSSDHFPIKIQIDQSQQKKYERRTRWNFKKARWDSYATASSELLSEVDFSSNDIDEITKNVNDAILKAAKKCIPKGCRSRYKPFWTENIEAAVKDREEKRKEYMKAPTIENKIAFNRTAAKAKLEINTAKRQKFRNACEDMDLTKEGNKAWSLLKNLSGEKKVTNPNPINSEGDSIAEDQKRAEKHNRYFASTNKAHQLNDQDKELLENLKAHEKAPQSSNRIFAEKFTFSELKKAMRKLKSRKSPGPDDLHNEMLTHLGHTGKKIILDLINLTWEKGELPKVWKIATIKPLLKKGKSPSELSSYRPISLTSCLGKLAERMVNARLYWWLEVNGILSKQQAGFRTGQRTEDQLFRLTQKIIDGFQEEKSTVGIFVDLQQAYDRVWRKGLLWKMMEIGVHGNLYKWIRNFLNNRLIQTKISNAFSSKAVLEEGLPQGSALSCTLFLLFINDLPKSFKSEKALYADDLTLWQTQNKAGTCAILLNDDLEVLRQFCDKWKLKLSSTKTVYTIFTMSKSESEKSLRLRFGECCIGKEENPVYLGVQLDRRLTFTGHINNLKSKASQRLRIVKRLASTQWGADKATLRQMYLGYVRSAMEYNLAMQNICSNSNQEKLNKVQNEAVRFISGGMRSTPIEACEIDANIEPLSMRREAAALEMVERYKRCEENNPNRIVVENWKGKDRIKKKSILKVAKVLETSHHLPENRKPEEHFCNKIPPNLELHSAQVETKLVEDVSKKVTEPNELLRIGHQTINTYPIDSTYVFTDGSAFKGTVNAGYGARIDYPNGSTDEISEACGNLCSNFEAEVFAIQSALLRIKETFQNNHELSNIVVFSDSKSALEAVENQNLKDSVIKDLLLTIHDFIEYSNKTITLQWIKSHCSISRNERADFLAKSGAAKEQPDTAVSQATVKKIIKSNSKIEWHTKWALSKKGRSMFNFVATPKKNDPINSLNRKDQVIIFRLRTTHVPLNAHLSRIVKNHQPNCALCHHEEEDVKHFLFDCPALADLRDWFLPDNPTLYNTLYEEKQQLEKTSMFFQMANSRRANAHMTTGS